MPEFFILVLLLMPVIIKVVITVTIHKAQQRVQDFSQVRNAFVSTVNAQTKQEAIRYDC